MTKIIPKETINEIIILYNDNNTIEEISKTLKISKSFISKTLKINNIKIKHTFDYSKNRFSQEKINEIINLYNEGNSIKRISENLSIEKTRIARLLKKNKIKIKDPVIYLKIFDLAEEQKILDLYSEENSISKISQMYNVSLLTISKIIAKNNITKRTSDFYNKKISKENEKEIIDLYEKDKLNLEEISKLIEVSPVVISKMLKSNNIKVLQSKDKRKLSLEDELEIINLYWKGYTTYQLAEKYNISRTSVRRIFIRNNVETGYPKMGKDKIKRKIYEDEYPKIIMLYNQGLTQEKIGNMYNVAEETIRKILHKNNVKTRTNTITKFNSEEIKKILELAEKNISSRKIAKIFNVDKGCILRVLNKNKVEKKAIGFFNRKLTEIDKNEIIKLYQEGLSLNKISKIKELTSLTIKRVLVKNNIKIKEGKDFNKKVTPELEVEIINSYKNNNLLKDVAKQFHLSNQTIHFVLKKNNINVKYDFRHIKKITDKDIENMKELYNKGININQIAKKLKFSFATVKKKLGLK
ncbi:MAG: helix-turn-helix domain-containing protein [Candidatus Sericytochromatia bacterium]